MKAFTLCTTLAAFALAQASVTAHAQDSGTALAMFAADAVPFPGIGGLTKPSAEPPAAPPYGDVTVAATGLKVTNGFSSRAVADVAANWYNSGWGLHLDASHEWREENATYVVAGVSYAVTPFVRPKILFGTSSANLGIQPQLYVRGEIEYQVPGTPGKAGLVLTPAITTREYRNGVKETVPEFHVALYLPEFADHTYFVTEAKALATFVQSVSGVGYELSSSATYVSPNLGTVGAELFGGRMVYDNTLCIVLCTVENRFIGVRPLVSFYLNHSDKMELFIRGEVVATDFYNIYGGTIGLKTNSSYSW